MIITEDNLSCSTNARFILNSNEVRHAAYGPDKATSMFVWRHGARYVGLAGRIRDVDISATHVRYCASKGV